MVWVVAMAAEREGAREVVRVVAVTGVDRGVAVWACSAALPAVEEWEVWQVEMMVVGVQAVETAVEA